MMTIKRFHLSLLLTAALSALLLSCTQKSVKQPHHPLIIAHRGGADLGIENSLSCIEKGIAAGVDMIEIDVHLTADKQVVVNHDYTLDRTTDMTGKIEDYTFAEVRQCRLKHKDGTVSEETIPTLAEVLAICKGRCPILLEIKSRRGCNEGIEALCDSIVKSFGMENEVVFQSFSSKSMEIIHSIDSTLRIELLLGEPSDIAFEVPYYASINVHYSMATPEYIEQVHKVGKEIKIWTLNDTTNTYEGVDGIITNCPGLFLKQ
ncbi:MAG: hypothetical protein IJ776_11260 [Paludibacteraceae bacterium]|nr:hypothetical protein [Paludibacteraceae bacterium]